MSPKPRTYVLLFSTALLVALACSPLLAQFPDGMTDDDTSPQIVARFLELTPEQRQEWRAIRRTANGAIRPLAQDLRTTEEALRAFLESDDPDATEIGNLLLAVHSLKQQIHGIVAQSVADFEAILDAEQTARLQALRRAAPLCRLVPAFRDVHLL